MRTVLLSLITLGWSYSAWGGVNFQLSAVSDPGMKVGSTVLFAAQPATGSPPLQFRFNVGKLTGPLQLVREFSFRQGFDWTSLEEGVYRIQAIGRNPATGETSEITTTYTLLPQATTNPVVSPSSNELVFLFSSPGCNSGRIRARFRALSSTEWQYTPWENCQPGLTYNTWLAGMRAATAQTAQREILIGGNIVRSQQVFFETGTPSGIFPSSTVIVPPDASTSDADGTILHSNIFSPNHMYPVPVATDLTGRMIWYYDRLRSMAHLAGFLAKPLPGGNMLMILSEETPGQVLREIDLAGNTLRETNMSTVREALYARGLVDRSRYYPGSFHHDATRLPNGHTLVLVGAEQIVSGVDYLADLVVDLDENLQPVWVFNTFDHVPLNRGPLREVCTSIFLHGCSQIFLAPWLYDLTHTNTVHYNPSDGSLLLSLRHQDWIMKVDYRNGRGSGAVLWRFGKDGDFTLPSSDMNLWFSHQHDVSMVGDQLILFDNGNTRRAQDPAVNSRGQLWILNEATRTAHPAINADLGVYSEAFGSAQRLSNGNVHFLASALPNSLSTSFEVLGRGPNRGQLRYTVSTNSTQYRSWRMRSLYEP